MEDNERAMAKTLKAAVTPSGIVIGENSIHLVGLDRRGVIVLRQKWSHGKVEGLIANTPPYLSGLEARVVRIIASSRRWGIMPS